MYRIKGEHREQKRESQRLKRLHPGSYRESGLHQLQETIAREGRKAKRKLEDRKRG